jgi:putative hydrolase of the HAD superfamily
MTGAVLFDLDGTLVEYERPAAEVLGTAFERVGVEPFFEVEAYESRYETFFPESESITHLRELIFADIADQRGLDPDIGVEVAQAYADERDHRRVYLLPGAREVLEAFSDRPMGMVTNGDPEMQRPKLAATGLEAHFETIVYAGHDAPAKPDPAPFHLALDRMAGDPDRSVYVGNDPEADVGGAAAAGLDSVWLRNGSTATPATEPTYTIDALADLLETTLLARSE